MGVWWRTDLEHCCQHVWWWHVSLVALGAVTLVRNEPVLAEESLWPLPETFLMDVEAWYDNPTRHSSRRMNRLLLGERANEDQGLTGVYLPSTDEDIVKNEACRHDVASILKVYGSPLLQEILVLREHLWPFLLEDSWGKAPDGILYGNLQPWGMLEECTDIEVEEVVQVNHFTMLNTTFQGRYCTVSFSSSDAKDGKGARTAPASLFGIGSPLFHYGTCIPTSCSAHDLMVSLSEKLNGTSKEVASLDCHSKEDVESFTSGDIAFIVVASVLWFLLLAAAIVDISINYWDVQHYRKGVLRFLLPFSAYTNMKKIFHVTNEENPGVISCLHGMRVLSMTWIVWGHTLIYLGVISINVFAGDLISGKVIDQTLLNATYSVDTFFFISGLLVAYGVLKEHTKVGRVNWIMYYVHRFIRLAPPIALTAASMATVFRFTMAGPLAMEVERNFVQVCRDSWWADVFFFTNFRDKMCLSHCWYTAVDSQIYLVLPLVLVPLLYTRRIGLAWLGVVTLVFIAVPVIIFAVYQQYPTLPFQVPEFEFVPGIDTYMTPWCRANVYLIGVWAGWILFTLQGKTIKLQMWQVLLGWVVATAMALLVIYGVANYDTFEDPDPLPLSVSVIYGGFSRVAWALALLWVVFACHTGYGGLVNTILSYPSWQPLSRLTFSMYLVCLPIQVLYLGAMHTPFYTNHLNVIISTCGFLFTGGLLSVVLSLMTEGPILGLEKVFYQRPGRVLSDMKVSSTTATT
ncbi:nose resistant to fluoxetine protein 6-like isoform X2 [Panulirus ornatus]|uniref:nose resistant to fluoxetine protein 6-like isoform X2 n=1 Tax=Panulirus ornatus TaxID=150431 RepID=UPI003A83A8D1